MLACCGPFETAARVSRADNQALLEASGRCPATAVQESVNKVSDHLHGRAACLAPSLLEAVALGRASQGTATTGWVGEHTSSSSLL